MYRPEALVASVRVDDRTYNGSGDRWRRLALSTHIWRSISWNVPCSTVLDRNQRLARPEKPEPRVLRLGLRYGTYVSIIKPYSTPLCLVPSNWGRHFIATPPLKSAHPDSTIFVGHGYHQHSGGGCHVSYGVEYFFYLIFVSYKVNGAFVHTCHTTSAKSKTFAARLGKKYWNRRHVQLIWRRNLTKVTGKTTQSQKALIVLNADNPRIQLIVEIWSFY